MCKPTSELWTETHGASLSIDLKRRESCKPFNEMSIVVGLVMWVYNVDSIIQEISTVLNGPLVSLNDF